MATRSRIALVQQDGTVHSIYCHHEGCPNHNGQVLQDHYQDRHKIEQLMALGNISSLGKEIGEKHDFEFRAKMVTLFRLKDGWTDWKSLHQDPEYIRLGAMCNAYARDRGDYGPHTKTEIDPNMDQLISNFAESDQEFLYVFGHPAHEFVHPDHEGWVVATWSNPNHFIAVSQAIANGFDTEGVAA